MINQFAYPLALYAIHKLLGIPTQDIELTRKWSHDGFILNTIPLDEEHRAIRYSPSISLRARYLAHVCQMQEQQADLGPLGEAIDHFCHLTDNFAAGLFQCYDVEGLPRTNNELEHCFDVARVHERRATGRRGAIPGVVVRGSMRSMLRMQQATPLTFTW